MNIRKLDDLSKDELIDLIKHEREDCGQLVQAWKRDAERYRWLKKQFRIMSPNMGGNHTWVLQRPLREGHSIDAVCDASMEQKT